MKVKAETIIRTICLVVALVNQGLSIYGKSPLPIADEQISQIVTCIITVVASLWAWWKNNSFTKAAIESDAYLEKLRG